jgi:hypothetical protein
MNLKPLRTSSEGSIWVEFFLKLSSQSQATGLGPVAD